MVNIGVRRR
jgi:hypothetical protein